ncbi:MAG TPA: VOC family protein [Dehalococcoidia bacterium]|nr:VOC family protein [Dehalococcoidia bacterium]
MGGAPSIQRLEHWTLVSSDVERTKRFYTEVLGAELPKRVGGPTSVNLAGTIIDFFPAGEGRMPSPGSGGQHHAYIIKLEDYDPWVEHFKARDVTARLTTHGLGRMSIYVDDPDGYHIELTVPFEDLEFGRREIEKRGLTIVPGINT